MPSRGYFCWLYAAWVLWNFALPQESGEIGLDWSEYFGRDQSFIYLLLFFRQANRSGTVFCHDEDAREEIM